MIYKEDGRWYVASELGPDDAPPRRQISEAAAKKLIEGYRLSERQRVEANERAKAPEYVI